MKKIAAIIAMLLASQYAYSATVVCGGTVEELAYHANNRLMIRLSSMNTPVYFCSPDSEWIVAGTTYKTGKESCKAMYSSFLSAKATKSVISTMYFDGEQVPTACLNWPDWASANIRFYRF